MGSRGTHGQHVLNTDPIFAIARSNMYLDIVVLAARFWTDSVLPDDTACNLACQGCVVLYQTKKCSRFLKCTTRVATNVGCICA